MSFDVNPDMELVAKVFLHKRVLVDHGSSWMVVQDSQKCREMEGLISTDINPNTNVVANVFVHKGVQVNHGSSGMVELRL